MKSIALPLQITHSLEHVHINYNINIFIILRTVLSLLSILIPGKHFEMK